MIWLSLPFWYSFTILDGLSKERNDLFGSPRALYEEGMVQPLDFTILPLSQRAWWAQLDNAGTLGGSFGHITFPEAIKKIIKWLLKNSIWDTKARKRNGMRPMMRVTSSTPSPAVSAPR